MIRPRIASASSCSSLPFSTARASCLSIFPMPLSSASWSASRTTTSQPAWAQICAIPWPIRPQPSTPTLLISIVYVLLSVLGDRAAYDPAAGTANRSSEAWPRPWSAEALAALRRAIRPTKPSASSTGRCRARSRPASTTVTRVDSRRRRAIASEASTRLRCRPLRRHHQGVDEQCHHLPHRRRRRPRSRDGPTTTKPPTPAVRLADQQMASLAIAGREPPLDLLDAPGLLGAHVLSAPGPEIPLATSPRSTAAIACRVGTRPPRVRWSPSAGSAPVPAGSSCRRMPRRAPACRSSDAPSRSSPRSGRRRRTSACRRPEAAARRPGPRTSARRSRRSRPARRSGSPRTPGARRRAAA